MNWRIPILLLLTVASQIGCRRNDAYMDAYFDLMNAEKRALEDRIYELEYENEKAKKELEKLKQQNTSAPESSENRQRPDNVPRVDQPEIFIPDVELPPGINVPSGSESEDEGSDGEVDADKVLSVNPASFNQPLGGNELATLPDDDHVDFIFLNPRLTGGVDLDGQPGDDGVIVTIEPRNRAGQFIPKPGRVSIAVLDPQVIGEAGRVARWDFDIDVAARVLKTNSLDRGLQFRAPWTGQTPKHAQLHIFVRFETEDGRRLEANREITIKSVEDRSEQWKPIADHAGRTIGENHAAARRITTIEASGAKAPPARKGAAGDPKIRQHASAKTNAVDAKTKSASAKGRFWKPYR